MPALRFLRRRWHIASDDLPLPSLMGALWHISFSVIIAIDLAFVVDRLDPSCYYRKKHIGYLSTQLGCFTLNSILHTWTFFESIKGSIFEDHLRKRVGPLVLSVIAVYGLTIGNNAYGTRLVYINDHTPDCPLASGTLDLEHDRLLEAIVIATWVSLFIGFLAMLITLNLFTTYEAASSPWRSRCLMCRACCCCCVVERPGKNEGKGSVSRSGSLGQGGPQNPSATASKGNSFLRRSLSAASAADALRSTSSSRNLSPMIVIANIFTHIFGGIDMTLTDYVAAFTLLGARHRATKPALAYRSTRRPKWLEGEERTEGAGTKPGSGVAGRIEASGAGHGPLLAPPVEMEMTGGSGRSPRGTPPKALSAEPGAVMVPAVHPGGPERAILPVGDNDTAVGANGRDAASVVTPTSTIHPSDWPAAANATTTTTATTTTSVPITATSGAAREPSATLPLTVASGKHPRDDAGIQVADTQTASGLGGSDSPTAPRPSELSAAAAATEVGAAGASVPPASSAGMSPGGAGVSESGPVCESAGAEVSCPAEEPGAPAAGAAGSVAAAAAAEEDGASAAAAEGDDMSDPPERCWDEHFADSNASVELVEEAVHYFKFATAVYGWKMYLWMNRLHVANCCKLCVGRGCGCCRQSTYFFSKLGPYYGPSEGCCSATKLLEREAITQLTGVLDQDILYVSYRNEVNGLLPYYVALDRPRRAIVVAVRGSLSLSDVVTDLVCVPEEFEIPGVPSRDAAGRPVLWAHRGMLEATRAILQDLREQGVLEGALAEWRGEGDGAPQLPSKRAQAVAQRLKGACSGWRVVVTGHSLGGGVTGLLGPLLRDQFPNLRCWAYAPPGGLMSPKAAEVTREFCISVVHAKDMIPRLGIGAMEQLVKRLLHAAACSRVSKAYIMGHLVALGQRPPVDQLLMPEQELTPELQRILTAFEHKLKGTPSAGVGRAFEDARDFEPPGHLLYIERRNQGEQEAPCCSCNVCLLGSKTASYACRWIRVDDFTSNGLVVSRSMFLDHLPDHTMRAMQQALDQLREAAGLGPSPETNLMPFYGGPAPSLRTVAAAAAKASQPDNPATAAPTSSATVTVAANGNAVGSGNGARPEQVAITVSSPRASDGAIGPGGIGGWAGS